MALVTPMTFPQECSTTVQYYTQAGPWWENCAASVLCKGDIGTSACSGPRVPGHVNHHVLQMGDLSLPMALCEPVTDMQRRADFLEYVQLLHEVKGTCHGPLQG